MKTGRREKPLYAEKTVDPVATVAEHFGMIHQQPMYLIPDQITLEYVIVPLSIKWANFIDGHDLYSKLPIIIGLIYILGLLVVLWLLGRILHYTWLTIIVLLLWLWWSMSVGPVRGVALVVTILALLLKKLVGGGGGGNTGGDPYGYGRPIYGLEANRPITIGGNHAMNCMMVILGFSALTIMAHYVTDNNFIVMLPIVILPLIYVLMISNVGGHSTQHVIFGIFIGMFGLLLYEPFRTGLGDVITGIIKPSTREERDSGHGMYDGSFRTGLEDIRLWDTIASISRGHHGWKEGIRFIASWFTPDFMGFWGVRDLALRYTITMSTTFMTMYFMIEDVCAADASIRGAVEQQASGRSPASMKGWAVNMASPWLWNAIINLIIMTYIGAYMRVLVMIVGFLVACLFWITIGSKTWTAEGEATTIKWIRQGAFLTAIMDTLTNRVMVLYLTVVIETVCFGIGYSTLGALVVACIAWQKWCDQRALLGIVAFLSFDISCAFMAYTSKPLNIIGTKRTMGMDQATTPDGSMSIELNGTPGLIPGGHSGPSERGVRIGIADRINMVEGIRLETIPLVDDVAYLGLALFEAEKRKGPDIEVIENVLSSGGFVPK